MRILGIRVAPTVVTFVVYDSDEEAVINAEAMRIPMAFGTPDALKFVRSNLLDVLREYKIEVAGLRVTEQTAETPSHKRIQIEGVIQEAFATSSLKSYYVGQIASISSRLGIDRTRFKKLVDGTLEWNVENWADLSEHQREALLCAIGAANA